jgi:hypothetical protein
MRKNETTSKPATTLSMIFSLIAVITVVLGIFSFGTITGAIWFFTAAGAFVTARLTNIRYHR